MRISRQTSSRPCSLRLDENGKSFSDDVIMSNLITMLLAGEDTTAFTLAWTVHQLCDSPQWAAELRSEADAVIGSANVAVDLDTANRLRRANAVANETMRLRPVAPLLGFLDANVDMALGDVFVPKGTGVVVLLRPPALDQTNFVDPLAFRPERWLEDLDGPQNVSAHLPFGSGPRMCPGRSLALLEMKTFLSMLYKNFDVERVGASADVSELVRLHDVACRAQGAAAFPGGGCMRPSLGPARLQAGDTVGMTGRTTRVRSMADGVS